MPERATGLLAAATWVALCLVWFDPAGPRPASALRSVLAMALALACAAALTAWVRSRWTVLRGERLAVAPRAGTLAVLLALAFRLPLAWQGAAGYVTPDGALSGIVALDVRDGRAHHVFVPQVPYSGSLKSHLAAPAAALVDPARAFALSSLFFYLVFVAALVALARRSSPDPFVPAAAGLYAAFAPPFVTRYSLSNDGNYVEVLALGTLALLLAARWAGEREGDRTLALAAGVALGLAFWCHIIAVVPLAAVAVFLLWTDARRALRSAAPLAAGFVLGDTPGLFWNAFHGGASFQYLVPGSGDAGPVAGPRWAARLLALVTDHLPVLLGYDFGYGRGVDIALTALAWTAVAAAAWGAVALARDGGRGEASPGRILLVAAAVNLAVAGLALPHIPGNPRYLLFLFAPAAIFVARALRPRAARPLLALVLAGSALGSLAQGAGALEAEARWRTFVSSLRAAGVRWCYSDFFTATKVNFLSGGTVTCSSKLGPTTTEYFFRFREEVDAAPAAALVPATYAAAEKVARRLDRLGVAYDRIDLMRAVLIPRGRKVDPEDVFPDREFPLR